MQLLRSYMYIETIIPCVKTIILFAWGNSAWEYYENRALSIRFNNYSRGTLQIIAPVSARSTYLLICRSREIYDHLR